MQQERKNSEYRRPAGAIESGGACHGHVESRKAGSSADEEKEAQPEPQGEAFLFLAIQRFDFLLHIRFLMQQIFQRIGFRFQRLPFGFREHRGLALLLL